MYIYINIFCLFIPVCEEKIIADENNVGKGEALD